LSLPHLPQPLSLPHPLTRSRKSTNEIADKKFCRNISDKDECAKSFFVIAKTKEEPAKKMPCAMTPADAGAVLGNKCRTARLAARLKCMSMCKGDNNMEGCEANCVKETRPVGGYAVSVEVCNKETHGAAAAVSTTKKKASPKKGGKKSAAAEKKEAEKKKEEEEKEEDVDEDAAGADLASDEEYEDTQAAGFFSA